MVFGPPNADLSGTFLKPLGAWGYPKVKGYVGHHMKSVKRYQNLAGDPDNIQFLTPKQHLLAHCGNWRNITNGRYME